VQEATLRSFFDRTGGSHVETGFLSRFLVAWPESTQGARRFSEAPHAWPPRWRHFTNAFGRCSARRHRSMQDGALSPAVITLACEAKAAW
jgi:putative DNA primase/helicase